MIIGKMDRRIDLQHRVLNRNDRHEEIVTYSTYATVWAQKEDLRGREYFAAQQMNAEDQTRWCIRWRDDVVKTDRIVFESINYNIRDIGEIPRHRGLEIMTTAVVP